MGFTYDAFDPDVLLEEFKTQANEVKDEKKDDEDKNLKPKRAKTFLLFMISSWSPDHVKIKHSIARFATGDGISSIFFINEIRNMIIPLSIYGLIVNNIVADGATENGSAMRAMATHTVG